jgi:cytochrome P450
MALWTLAMIAYPETQVRAQAELDAVVGRDRLPTFADYPHLPYVRAMVKEILRWKTVAPLGLPHRVTEDDWYEGMFIPKGTICIPNIWLMNRDPEVYGENAAQFEPARHLDANGNIASALPDTKDEGHVSYGFGRRECPGRHVANNSLFINMAIILWAMKIERKKDASGRSLPLDVDSFVDQGIVVSVDSSHALNVDADLGFSQTSSPLRMRALSALLGSSSPACTGAWATGSVNTKDTWGGIY